MVIQADQVKQLRMKTGAGLMDCKRALQASKGDLEQALDHLRKSGLVKAAKKSGRETKEGLVGMAVAPDGSALALVEVLCETDFVARTDPFQEWVTQVAKDVLANHPTDLESLKTIPGPNGKPVGESLTALIAKLGENMAVNRFFILQADSGQKVGGYLHMGDKLGAAVQVVGDPDADALKEVSMQIAAMSPRYVSPKEVPAAVLAKEKEIIMAQPEIAKKPANIQEKIVEGKLASFYREVCLSNQISIKDTSGKKTVQQLLQEKDANAEIVKMVRCQVGEVSDA